MDNLTLSGTSLDADIIIFRKLFAFDSNTFLPVSTASILGADGIGGLNWQNIFANISSYSAIVNAPIPYLPSTLYSFSSQLLTLSTITGTTFSTLSTQDATNFSTLSTFIGNGGIPGSITSVQLQSTVSDIYSTTKYISSGNLISTTVGFLTGPFNFNTSLTSTAIGLGTFGYVSSSQLISTVSSILYTFTNLAGVGGTNAFISSSQLTSTVQNLGSAGYVSSTQLRSSVSSIYLTTTNNFISTNIGLGTFGYISSPSLYSTTTGLFTDLRRNVNVDRAGNLNVYNSQVTVSSLENLAFLSSFYMSTMIYEGSNGSINANNPTSSRDLIFTSAKLNLNLHSNFIVPSSYIVVDAYPLFAFNYVNMLTNPNATQIYALSTLIECGNGFVSTGQSMYVTNTSFLIGNQFSSGLSNIYQTPIRLCFTGRQVGATPSVRGFYEFDYKLYHRIPDVLSSNTTPGITDSNMAIYYGTTNSVFVTITNLPIPS
jgi:hypothetical protein